MESFRNKIRTLWYIIKYQYLFRNTTFGPNIRIRCRLKIMGQGKVVVGSNCIFESDPWGDDYVTIYTHRSKARISIGNNVLMRATRMGSHLSISIGNNSTLECSSIYDSDFHNVDVTKRDEGFNEYDRAVVIGQGCNVGCMCLCAKGTVLGQNVTLLPGSVVSAKKIPDNSVVAGNPAKFLKK